MDLVFSMQPGKETPDHASENIEFTSAEKTRMSRSQFKNMLVCFFDHKGIVQYEFIVRGQTVNQPSYLEGQKRLRESVRRKRPEIWLDKCILDHDNTPAHDAIRFREFLAKKSITNEPSTLFT
jgi:hypothetical protein